MSAGVSGGSRGGDAAGSSTVTQDYLKAVWAAGEWGGQGASVTGLARRMGVAPSTASENVSRLVEEGLLAHEPYKAVTLTPEGRLRAMAMVRRHRILETYLVTRLGFEWDEVHAEAEELEHAVSDRLLERLDVVLGRPIRDPHGDPIPTADGQVVVPELVPLEALRVGARGIVGRIRDDSQTLRHLARAGIRLDTRVRLVDRGTMAPGEAGGRRRRACVVRVCGGRGAGLPDAVVPEGSLWLCR
ncbi:metal-dependent transcriptional regulator [Actinomyces sp. 2119]|uniref:Manganese transport regulator n=1 Tax=Actinomyces lilanjuaniae TaxID=2321394 RepID=A0ABN5PS82_9ACTO|nr:MULTISPECIES: metal-dependent transcriptional regulator [Actinomyces]AYD89989.1 metal-dependent transcriptional regulator [Actinomyces lilanjuaniae]RJF42472.1 metal-dependent transcriptional regulator [Actinomyces sp. 2119]